MVHEHQVYTDTNVDTLEDRITYTYVIFRELAHVRFTWWKLEISCNTFQKGHAQCIFIFPEPFSGLYDLQPRKNANFEAPRVSRIII